MSSKDIYAILSSKPHNAHYLTRYCTFIESCSKANSSLPEGTYTEKHHICPKAKDMFPEYTNFRDHPWNKAVLTARQHYIAHWMLWKCYKNSSQSNAFWRMNFKQPSNKQQYVEKINSKTYQELKKDKSFFQSILATTNANVIEGRKIGLKNNNEKRKKDGSQSKLMKELWENGTLREKQKEFFESERGKKTIELTVARMKIFNKSEEARANRRETANKLHNDKNSAIFIKCEYCGIVGKNIYGNMSKHIKKCKDRANRR